MKPFIVGIAGGSASGKSTLAGRLQAELAEHCLLIEHDRYYLSLPTHLRKDPLAHNFDHPDSLDTARLVHDLEALGRGETTDLPVFDFPTHARANREESFAPKPIILVDGILVLADPVLAARFDKRIYVHTPDDIRLIRRIRRDIVSRGRTAMQVLAQYERTVRPMHKQYVEPSREAADLVLDGTGDIDENIARIRNLLPL